MKFPDETVEEQDTRAKDPAQSPAYAGSNGTPEAGRPTLIPDSGWKMGLGGPSDQPIPGEPLGLKQVQEEQRAGRLMPYQMPNGSWSDVAERWYTGANAEGMDNGWDTEFFREASRQRGYYLDEAWKKQDPTVSLDWLNIDPKSPGYNPNATGVALWDDPNGYGRGDGRGIRHGDVFDQGKWVYNLYEKYKDDRMTADLLMIDWVLEKEVKGRAFQSDNIPQTVAHLMDEQFADSSKDVSSYVEVARQKEAIQAQQEENLDNPLLTVLNAAVPGVVAAAAVTLPSLATGWGAPFIIAGTGIAAGTAAYWNRDYITFVEARAMEMVTKQREQFKGTADDTWLQTLSVASKEWGMVLQSTINPLQNTVQGITDDVVGDVGDGIEGFYDIDPETGERYASTLAQGLNMAAMFGDSFLQFTNPVSSAVYIGTMGLTTAGGIGQLASMNAGYNERTGQFESYDDAREVWAAAGGIGIDAVQMFTGAGLMSLSRQARRGLGIESSKGFSTTTVTGGWAYKVNALGEATSRRFSIQMLAPSEMVGAIITGSRARSLLRARGGGSTRTLVADDYYRAAREVIDNSRVVNALTTAVGEGVEEAVQAVLEPISFTEEIDARTVWMSAAQGALAGGGMSVGAAFTRMTGGIKDRRERINSNKAHGLAMIMEDREISDEEWRSRWGRMTDAEKRRATIVSQKTAAGHNAVVKKVNDDMALVEGAVSVIGQRAREEMLEADALKALQDVNPEAAGMYQLQARPSHRATGSTGLQQQVFGENAALMSLFEVMSVIRGNHAMTARDIEDVATDEARWTKQLQNVSDALAGVNDRIARGDKGLEDIQAELTAKVAHAQRLLKSVTERKADIAFDRPMSQQVVDFLQEMVDRFNEIDVNDLPRRAMALDQINDVITAMSESRWAPQNVTLSAEQKEAVRRAVEFIFIREPKLGLSSYDMNIPQASHDLTFTGTNRIVQTVASTFKPKNADTDGDAYAILRSVYLKPALRAQIRRGIQFFAASEDVVELEDDESGNVVPMSAVRESLGDRASIVLTEAANEASIVVTAANVLNDPDPTRQAAAQALLDELRKEFFDRYVLPKSSKRPNSVTRPPIKAAVMREAWKQFEKDLKAKVPEARVNFMNAIVGSNPVGILEMADETFRRETPHMMSRIFDLYDHIGTEGAAQKSDQQSVMTPTGVAHEIPGRQGLHDHSVVQARTAGHTLQAIAASAAERRSQHQHYSPFRTLALVDAILNGGYLTSLNKTLMEAYALLGGTTESELEKVANKYSLEDRVIGWLADMLDVQPDDPNAMKLMLVASQALVPKLGRNDAGEVEVQDGEITVLQLLVRRSLEIERIRHEGKPEADPVWNKLKRIEMMTHEQGPHSYTAKAITGLIFGGYANAETMGEDAKFVGSQLNGDQMLKLLMSQNLNNRRSTVDRWRRQGGWVKFQKLGDPPYSMQDLKDGKINAYAIMIDAIAALANTSEDQRTRNDVTGSSKFAKGFTAWRDAVTNWHLANEQRHIDEGLTTREQWAKDLIKHRTDWARPIIKAISKDAHRDVFPTFMGRQAGRKWVMEMLAMEDPAQAEVFSFLRSQYAIFNAAQGTTGLDDDDGMPHIGDGKVRFSDMNSQFLRMMMTLMLEDPTRLEVYSFVEVAERAKSMEDLRDMINGHPNWLRNNSPWHPYTNDVSQYESNSTDLFGGISRDTARMEELSQFETGAQAMQRQTATSVKEQKQREILIDRMKDSVNNGSNIGDAKAHVKNLYDIVEQKKIYPSAVGPRIMMAYFMMSTEHWAIFHDKGEPAEELKNLGNPVVFMNAFGMATDLEQEADAILANTAENLLSNPVRLLRTPVVMQNNDGSETIVDFTTPEKLLDGLGNPVLAALAQSVIESSVWDLDAQGRVVAYTDRTEEGRPLQEILERTAKFIDVFDENIPPLQRALRGIGMIEAALREEALTLSLDQQDAMNFPITRMINDFVNVYMTSVRGDKMPREDIVEKAVVAVWESLLLIADTPVKFHSQVQATLESLVLAQWGDPLAEFDLTATSATKALMDAKWITGIIERYTRRQEELNGRVLALTAQRAEVHTLNPRDPQLEVIDNDLEFLAGEIVRLNESLTYLTKKGKLPRRLFGTWEAILNKHTLTGDPDVDLKRKQIIAKWLYNGNQGNRFDGKEAQPLVQELTSAWGNAQDRQRILTSADFSDKMWNELGAMAAALEIEGLEAQPASWTTAVPLTRDDNPKSWNKYFDVTFASTANTLFDPYILKAVRRMRDQASYVNREEFGWRTATDRVFTKLFPRDLVTGDWDSTVVKQALWVQQGLSISTVAMTIPIGGDLIDRMSEEIASGMATEGQPRPEHYTKAIETIALTKDQHASVDLYAKFPVLKFEHHFVKTITLTPTSGNVPKAAIDDFNRNAGQQVLSVDGAEVEGHTLWITSLVGKRIEELRRDYGMTTFTLEVEYVDVDKKPHTPEHVNSPLFDGLGRDAIVGGYASPMAAMLFGLGALANVMQQDPLNALAKAGQSFRGYLTSLYSTRKQLEQGTISEQIRRKTTHMWERRYTFGFLLYGDLPAIYKWMKSRHLVSGTNPVTGEQELWWSEKYITAEETGDPGILQNPKLISISNKTYKRLIGAVNGVAWNGAASAPVLTLQDVDRFPVLTKERLRFIGLEKLGQQAGLAQSDIRRQGLRPVHQPQRPRNRPYAPLSENAHSWRKVRDEAHQLRGGTDGSWSPKTMTDQNDALQPTLEAFVLQEHSLSNINMLLVPDTRSRNLAEQEAAVDWALSLALEGAPNALKWHLMYGQKPTASPGLIDSQDVAAGFPMHGKRGLTYQDVVMVEMESYLLKAQNHDPKEALELLKPDLAKLRDLGVTIILVSRAPQPEFRTMASQWLISGQIGYKAAFGTSTIFIPREEMDEKTKIQITHNSTRIATNSFIGKGTTLEALHPRYGSRGPENTTFVDWRYDPEYLFEGHDILPTAMTSANGGVNPMYAYGWPRGQYEPVSSASVITRLKDMLNDQRIYDYLLEQLGPDPDMPIFKRHPNGTFDPGILGREDALARLKEQVDAGILPGMINTETWIGGLVVSVANNGTILVGRDGFKPPDRNSIDKQLAATLPGRQGGAPLGIVVSSNKFDKRRTISPPMLIVDTHDDEFGLRVTGEYVVSYISKWIDVLGTYKTAQAPIPANGQFVTDIPIGNQQDDPLRITRHGAPKEPTSKGSVNIGAINNWRNAGGAFGYDFREELLYFFGYDPDSMSAEEFKDNWNELSDLLSAFSDLAQYPPEMVHQALIKGSFMFALQENMNSIRQTLRPLARRSFDFADKPEPIGDERDYIARQVLAVLAMEGFSLADVAYSKGANEVVGDEEVTLMPDELSARFATSDRPDVEEYLRNKLNRRVYKPGVNGQPAYFLNPGWTFQVQYFDRETGKDLVYEERLRLILPLPAKENSTALTQQVLNRGPRASITPHTATIDAAALGGELVTERDPYRAGSVLGPHNRVWSGREAEGEPRAGFYDMLSNVSKTDPNYTRQPKMLLIMQRFVDRATQKMAAYHHTVEGQASWANLSLVNEKADKFLDLLNLDKTRDRVEIDYLVRQFWGAPGPIKGQEDYHEQIDEKLYLKALEFMIQNVQRNMHPLHGGVVPMEHKVFWEKLYKAQIGAAKPWALVAEKGGKLKKHRAAGGWDEWVTSLVTQVRESDQKFAHFYGIDVAGFWQTYQGTMSQFDVTSVSPNQLLNLAMMSPDLNEFMLSLDPNVNAILSDPMLLDTVDKTLDVLTGQTSDYPDVGELAADALTIGDRSEHISKWMKKQGLPRRQKHQKFRSYVKEGQLYLESDRQLNAFAGFIMSAQIINRLFIPALWVAAMIEVPLRSGFDHATNIIMGEHTGAGGARISRTIEKAGYNPRYSVQDIAAFDALAPSLGASNELSAEVFQVFRDQWSYGGAGRINSSVAKLAHKTSMLFADPRRGMRNATIGRLYLNGVHSYLEQTNSSISMQQLASELARDPLYLKKAADRGNEDMMNAHQAGINRVAQSRGFRKTFTGKLIMSPVYVLLGSSGNVAQNVGAFLFGLFAFTAYLSNVFIMLTGMQAPDQAFAYLLNQRMNWLSRLVGFVQGSDFDPEKFETFDMSDVMDGYKLSRAFVQSGMSWTTLFAMGFMASGLGLTGEDPEERRRRRASLMMNLPPYLDPVKPDANNPDHTGGGEFDFRQAGLTYLDETPFATYFMDADGRSVIKPHWTIAQYTYPIMGMARFFESGDLRELVHGFWDAAAVIPNSAVMAWRQANETVDILTTSMEETDNEGTSDSGVKVRNLLINTVGIIGRQLTDNQFINTLWVASDEIDRAPWLYPATNPTGEILRDPATQYPSPQEQALSPIVYTDPQTGEQTGVGAKYTTRNDWGLNGTITHAFAETSATWFVLGSLFTAQWNPATSDFNRKNMVPREVDVPLTPKDQSYVEATLYGAFMGKGSQPNVTEDEITRILRNQADAAGADWDQDVLEAKAEQLAKLHTEGGALSVLSPEGFEMLTKAGVDSVLSGLQGGSVKLDSPSLRGVWASREMLASIEADWKDRLEVESRALGMTKSEADYRWRRFWWGDPDDPESPGLKYLFDAIPNDPDAHYTQLNVTYVIGPNGKPWATPITKQDWVQAFLPMPSRKAQLGPGLRMDARANVVDEVLGINTGLNALVKSPVIIEEPEKTTKSGSSKTSTPSKYRKFPSFSSGGSYGPPFVRMNPLPETGVVPRPDDIPFINVSTPYVRRANVNKERITSERGRLKQWQ